MSEPDMSAAVKAFFSSPRYAVAGASSDTAKFGYKVFSWYLARSLPVTPLNPSRPSISADGADHPTAASPSALQAPDQTSLSVITPPKVTKGLLREAKHAGVKAVWLQPGSFDDEVLDFAKDAWPGAVVAGDGGRGSEGWCVLVDGDAGLRAAGREQGRL